jgi:hypothetical protein
MLREQTALKKGSKACFECGTALNYTDAFCGKCGRRVSKESASSHRAEKRALDDELKRKSLIEYTALNEAIRANAARANGYAGPIILLMAVLLAVCWFAPASSFRTWAAIVCGVIAILAGLAIQRADRWLTRGEYYSITGALDQRGEHRCIFCGARGIFRQGQYATNNSFAKCSKCQKSLFAE